MKHYLLALPLLLPSLTFAQASQELMDKLSNIKSFDARFEQTIAEKGKEAFNKTSGYLKILRPGLFYWMSEQPDEILVVADGDSIWTYDMELEQIVQNDQQTSMGQSPAAILAGEVVDLDQEYEITSLEPNECLDKVDTCFQLSPKAADSVFMEIKIGFSGTSLQSIVLQDALDQTIETRFFDVKINAPMDKKLFDFTPPPGVDLIKGKQ